MGGDFAPAKVVEGAFEAVSQSKKIFEVVLVGDQKRVEAEVKKYSASDRISLFHTSQIIEMHESPTIGLKTKKDSSIVKGLELHRANEVQGFVSAGNTGAVMAASTLILGRIENVSRPTIGAFIPNAKDITLFLDAGANVDSKARHLAEFAMMGSIYAQHMQGKNNPRVGLLNIGEEESKGNEVSLDAYALLKKTNLNFIGNVEGNDILNGSVDVVICDGFVGNIILKFAEGVLVLLKAKFKNYASQSFIKKIWMGLMSGSIRSMLKDMDYQSYGGVPLLGVNGVSIIGHGKSTPKAICNMILKAEEMIDRNINQYIQESMKRLLVDTSSAL